MKSVKSSADGRLLPSLSTNEIVNDSARNKVPPFQRLVAYKFEKSTLLLDSHSYHQLDDKGVTIDEQRKLKILKQRSNVVYLAKSIRGTDNKFEAERRKDGHNYYREWSRAYRVVGCET